MKKIILTLSLGILCTSSLYANALSSKECLRTTTALKTKLETMDTHKTFAISNNLPFSNASAPLGMTLNSNVSSIIPFDTNCSKYSSEYSKVAAKVLVKEAMQVLDKLDLLLDQFTNDIQRIDDAMDLIKRTKTFDQLRGISRDLFGFRRTIGNAKSEMASGQALVTLAINHLENFSASEKEVIWQSVGIQSSLEVQKIEKYFASFSKTNQSNDFFSEAAEDLKRLNGELRTLHAKHK